MSEQAATAEAERPLTPWRRIGRAISLLLVVSFVALLVYGLLTKGTSDRIDQSLREGRPIAAPRFDLDVLQEGQLPARLRGRLGSALEDGKLSIRELRGTPFVLNMWASWCTPCRDEARPLEAGWKAAGRRGVLFLGLDIQDITSDARAFLSEFDVTYPSVREPDKQVANEYGATGIPETFFVDKRGRVVGHVIGSVDAKQLGNGVAAALSGQVAGVGSGGESFETR